MAAKRWCSQPSSLVEAAGAGLPLVDLLEGDDVGGELGDLAGQGRQDGAGGLGVADVRAGDAGVRSVGGARPG